MQISQEAPLMGDRVSNNTINEKQQGAVELLKGRERGSDLKERRKKIPHCFSLLQTQTSKGLISIRIRTFHGEADLQFKLGGGLSVVSKFCK